MVIKEVALERVCGITSELPLNACPEVAFAGRSNVGKSSLINALMRRKSLARTSSQPGKTQTINYYKINQAFYLVDLPGYGYATSHPEEKAKWGKMIENYLHSSQQLKRVFLLLDIRHEPNENDCMMYEWIRQNGLTPILIATKADKIKRSQLERHKNMILQKLGAQKDTVLIPFSALNKEGLEEIYAVLDQMLMPPQDEVAQ
jgi:GTP-binding protein